MPISPWWNAIATPFIRVFLYLKLSKSGEVLRAIKQVIVEEKVKQFAIGYRFSPEELEIPPDFDSFKRKIL